MPSIAIYPRGAVNKDKARRAPFTAKDGYFPAF